MLQLPNNCRAGKFSVYPKNWKSNKADKNLSWRVTYWFFDDNLKKKKQVKYTGMNMYDTLAEKQDAVKKILHNEERDLKQGVNHIQKIISDSNAEISENTFFVNALNYAFKNLHVEPETKKDIKSALKFITESILTLHYDRLTIKNVGRKHVRSVLDQCGKITKYKNAKGVLVDKKWSENLYNHYRKYLSILFKELEEIDIIDVNPVRAIKKRAQLKKIRETLSHEDGVKVLEFLREKYYSLYRFVVIFTYSGAREIELLGIKKKDVNIAEREFKIVVKKGRKYEEVLKAIKPRSLFYWEEIFEMAKDNKEDDYIFSYGLAPGPKLNSRYQLSKRWRNHVKKKLGINADMYSLKHSHLEAVAAKEGIDRASEAAGHSGVVITSDFYAQGEKKRKLDRQKKIDVPLFNIGS